MWSKVRKGQSKVAVLNGLCLICIANGLKFFFNYDQNQCQERMQAATEQNHRDKNTKHKSKDKKEEIKKDKKQQFADD